MTFDEWWKTRYDCCCDCKDSCAADCVKCKAKRAWQAAQPKWTYCKDGMPKNGQFIIAIIKNTYDNAYYSLVGWYSSSDFEKEKYISAYISGEAMMIDDNGLNCSFIAWMSLPEAPNVHDD